MDHLITDLLDVASIGAGRLSLELRHNDAGTMVQAACETLQPIVEEAELEFLCDIPADAPAVLAASDRIAQLLSNLIGNSAKFTAEGGKVEVGLEARDGEMRFHVTDTGKGIPAEELRYIFEQFWQARRDGRTGAGLGLAISHGIVEAHGGRIWEESQDGRGSTFFFTFPVPD